jgi:branched-chain amino acid transport system ATP-binding protein
MNKMLEFKDVELYYDHVYALKGVSIDLSKGETVALIGANGAGKSSIWRDSIQEVLILKASE